MSYAIVFSIVIARVIHLVNGEDFYRAAAYEYMPYSQKDARVTLSRHEALEIVMENIRVYDEQARLSKKNDTDIIVFPENGLYGYDLTRDSIKPYLEYVPDPEWQRKPWSPCTEPDRFSNKSNTDILNRLSCIAWDNGLFVVANMASKESCDGLSDPYCPADNQYQYNTNVIFDRDGVLVARYRKYYLYWQAAFDRPPRQEIITFNTEFGTFGTFTSGDILYKRPAFDLVQRCRVNSIVVPMTWDNTFPFPLAIEIQQGFAINMEVNLIVANSLQPEFKIGGSGIYSSNGAIVFHYNRRSFKGKLMMADLPIIPENHPHVPKTILPKIYKTSHVPIIKTVISGNKFKITPLGTFSGTKSICDGSFCCHVKFRLDKTRRLDSYVLGAFNGQHTKLIDLGIQVCGIVKCAGTSAASCGRRTFTSRTKFQSLTMWANFTNPHDVLPFVLLNGMSLGQGEFAYGNGIIYAKDGFPRPVIDIVLFGRNFARDPTIIPLPVNRTRHSSGITQTPTTSRHLESLDKNTERNIPSSATVIKWVVKVILSITGLNIFFQFDDKWR